ncbi:MAG: nuclear transport factor 2 family protein [Arenibacterium sp.]
MADKTSDKTPFHAINDAFNAAAAARDPDAMLSLYSNDTIWIAPNAPKAQGLDTPRATYEFVFGNDATLSHTLDDVMMSDDGSLAVMIGNFDFSAPSLNLADTGTYLFVLSSENGNWKIVADMFNSDQPAQ